MPISINRQRLVDAIVDGVSVIRNSSNNRISLPIYISAVGSASVSSGSSYVDVVHIDNTTDYTVLVEVEWNTTVYITGKSSTGFRINFGTAPTSTKIVRWVKVKSI